MQGLGNDYIYLDARQALPDDLPRLARRLSDRHFGIGGDGIVLITDSRTCDFGMRIFNADGSEAQMCGNASRCVAKYVYDRGLTRRTTLTLETLAGVRVLSLHLSDNQVDSVTVDMGIPRDIGPIDLAVEGQLITLYRVDMGNPHAVCFVDTLAPDDPIVPSLGPLIESHPAFPERTNVEFVARLSPSDLTMRVYERGSGETLACGTGACAAAFAARTLGMTDPELTVHLLGGDLQIRLGEDQHAYMAGPAAFVFDGEIEL